MLAWTRVTDGSPSWKTGRSVWGRITWSTLSVVVPTRDRPQLLARALTSIMAQAYPGIIECIVVFDQSQPHLPSMQSREGRRLRSLVNERTPGPAGARNTGALAATGEL